MAKWTKTENGWEVDLDEAELTPDEFCCFQKFQHPFLVGELKALRAQVNAAVEHNEDARRLLASILNADPDEGLLTLIMMVKMILDRHGGQNTRKDRIVYRAQKWPREHATEDLQGADLALYHAVLWYEHELDKGRTD